MTFRKEGTKVHFIICIIGSHTELLKDHWSFQKIKDQDQLTDLDHHPLKYQFKFNDLDPRSDHSKRSLNINRLLCWSKKVVKSSVSHGFHQLCNLSPLFLAGRGIYIKSENHSYICKAPTDVLNLPNLEITWNYFVSLHCNWHISYVFHSLLRCKKS